MLFGETRKHEMRDLLHPGYVQIWGEAFFEKASPQKLLMFFVGLACCCFANLPACNTAAQTVPLLSFILTLS